MKRIVFGHKSFVDFLKNASKYVGKHLMKTARVHDSDLAFSKNLKLNNFIEIEKKWLTGPL